MCVRGDTLIKLNNDKFWKKTFVLTICKTFLFEIDGSEKL